jgi:hypothetical protein
MNDNGAQTFFRAFLVFYRKGRHKKRLPEKPEGYEFFTKS